MNQAQTEFTSAEALLTHYDEVRWRIETAPERARAMFEQRARHRKELASMPPPPIIRARSPPPPFQRYLYKSGLMIFQPFVIPNTLEMEARRQRLKSVTKIVRIEQIVADHYGLTLADMQSGSKKPGILPARLAAMYLAKLLTKASFPGVAQALKLKCHTTVMHTFGKQAERRARDAAYDLELTRLEILIQADAEACAHG